MKKNKKNQPDNEFYKSLINSVNVIIYRVDEENRLTFINDAIKNYNLSPENLTGKSVMDIVHPEDREKLKFYLDEMSTNTRTDYSIEIRILVRDPENKEKILINDYFHISTRSIYNESENYMGSSGIAYNITELKKIQLSYINKNKLIKEYINLAATFILVVDYYLQVSLINKSGCETLGYSKEDVLGKNWLDNFVSGNDKDRVREALNSLFNKSDESLTEVISLEYSILTEDNREKTIVWNITPVKDEHSKKIGVICTGQDVTEKRKTEMALRESRSLLDAAINTMPFDFWVQDRMGKIIMQNSQSKKIWGDQLGKENLVQDRSSKIMEDLNSIQKRAFSGETVNQEIVDDDNHTYNSITAPVMVNKGIHGLVNLSIDISGVKENEKKLRTLVDHTVHSLGRAAEVFDRETGDHTKRIGSYCRLFAELLGKNREFQTTIEIQSQLHDVGKIHIPTEILNKPSRLTEEEFNIIKNHTVFGGLIIGRDDDFTIAQNIALYHHERWDGSGYPDGLIGNEIPLEARITSISDVFDALISKRSYKESISYEDTYKVFIHGDDRISPHKHFDPELLQVFLNNYDKFTSIHKSSIDTEETKNYYKMNVLFIDDDQDMINFVKKYFSKYFSNIKLFTYNSTSDFNDNFYKEKIYPHLCYIDINLPDGTGHDIAKVLRKNYSNSQIICITGSRSVDNIKLYDRIFHKPITPTKIGEITKIIWEYYFRHD